MANIVPFRAVRNPSLEAKITAIIEEEKACGNLQPALATMAQTLQKHLALAARTQAIPHAHPMEVIMRGVTAVIIGDNSPYVQEKLVDGCCSLLEARDPNGHAYELHVEKRR